MPERWRSQLTKIDRLEPSSDLWERAEAGPFLPEPRPTPMTRAIIVAVAVFVAAAGSWGAFGALRGGNRTVGSGDAFDALWPETSLADAQQVQAQVDGGDGELQWRTQAPNVALKYAEQVLHWPAPIVAAAAASDVHDAATVRVHGPIASCEGAECDRWRPARVAVNVTLRQVVRSGEGGIWSVTAAASAESNTSEEPRPRIGGWPEDVNGDGTISDTGDERIPELIKAVGDNGINGYIRYEDSNGPQPSNPTEAAAMSGKSYVIPVYAADGLTVVDWYTLSSDGAPRPSPGG